ncbi:MAG: DUF1587 domain-containing protein, partial [Longimicrobiales bacterium]
MKSLATAVVVSGITLVVAGSATHFGLAQPEAGPVTALTLIELPAAASIHTAQPLIPPSTISPAALTGVVRRVCGMCHNDQLLTGNLSLEKFDVARAAAKPEITEKMIAKLRAGMMPPPGIPRPQGDTMKVLVETLEQIVDAAAAVNPEPGARTFQRLNRAEYERSIRDLLTLQVDAGAWLPLDTKSANFDNIADVQMPSATLLDAYLDAASEISRLAVGDPQASTASTTYKIARLASQWSHVVGAP